MSLRTFQRITMVSVLALGAFATGCDEDTTEPTADAGKPADTGTPTEDAEVDASEPPPVGKMCGDRFCVKGKAVLGQCCVDDGNVCGIDLRPPGMDSLGCFPENADGKPSAHCGVVLDTLEPMGTMKGFFEIDAGGTIIAVPPCCTAAGTCGVDGNKGNDASLNLGVGCLAASNLAPPPDPTKPGPSEPGNGLPLIPDLWCNPADGTKAACKPIPPFLLGACPAVLDTAKGCITGVEENLRGCGADAKDDWDRVSTRNLCINRIAADKWGCDPISAGTLGRIPEFACGCGAGVATPQCIANVATTTCGSAQVIKGSPVLAGLPNAACGCGDGIANTKPPGPGFCLSRAAMDACGLIPACTEGTACASVAGGAIDGLCLDLFGTGGTVDSMGPAGVVKGDDIGDFCFKPAANP